MPIIDADTHIDETEATWEYLRDFEQEYKPITQYPSRVDPSKNPSRYWLVDGHRQMRFVRDDNNTRTTVETRELLDVQKRLARHGRHGHRSPGALSDAIFDGSHRASGSFHRAAAQLQPLARRPLRRIPRPLALGLFAAADEHGRNDQRTSIRQRSRRLRHSKERRLGSRQMARRSVFLPFVRRSQSPGSADLHPHRFRHARLRLRPANFLSALSCARSCRRCMPFIRSSAINCR